MSENNNLTREEAKQALNEGKKVKHLYFKGDEYIAKHSDEFLIDQNGDKYNAHDFWKYRSNGMFAEGWSIID